MLVIEYVNVLSQGEWQQRLIGTRWGQYVLASFLGALPGCLGPFAVVSLFAHGMVSVGAVVAAMIATSGDEAFIMLAMIPETGLLLIGALFVVGIPAGYATDALFKRHRFFENVICEGFETHTVEECRCLPPFRDIATQWRACSAARGILSLGLVAVLAGLLTGKLGPASWNWIKVTMVGLCLVALFITSVVPDHFLQRHLWEHVARKHLPRVFLWTLGTLALLAFLTAHLPLNEIVEHNKWTVLALAALVGIIPESGPHFLFVTLYAEDMIPLSILVASSIVQDGHGMLPMLAYSRKVFVGIKAINLIIGLALGALMMLWGF
jgi:hypothetical protein